MRTTNNHRIRNVKAVIRNSRLTGPFYKYLWKIKTIIVYSKKRHFYKEVLIKLKRFQDAHSGKRCFIIGNGPSLTTDDLNKLIDEYTFASNRVFMLFNQTNWRPTYYGICDRTLFDQIKSEADMVNAKAKFIPLDFIEGNEIRHGYNYFSRVPFNLFRKYPQFSENIHSKMYEGSTITYYLIQIAVYMGFKEIYLLGVDFNYSISMDNKGRVIKNNDVKDYFYEGKAINVTMPNLEQNFYAYQSAKKHCGKNGIKIYNTTRGGKLEVFERIDFDTLF